MPVISITVTEDGFHVPGALARQLGLEPGQQARVAIRKAPDAADVQDRAKAYCWRFLGDAIGAGEPVWNGEFWTVPLLVRDRGTAIGRLLFTGEGDVVPERSSTKEQLLETLGAARSDPAAA